MVPGDLRRRIQAQSIVPLFAPNWDIDAEHGISARGGGEQGQLQRYTVVAQLLRSLGSCWIDSAVCGARSIRTRAMRLWSISTIVNRRPSWSNLSPGFGI